MNTLSPGRYWIGDLCYVMHDEWNEVCDLVIDDTSVKDGIFQLKDGRMFSRFSTYTGDGQYLYHSPALPLSGPDRLPVDSGAIGCILESDIKVSNSNLPELGIVIDIPNSFKPYERDGSIWFSSILVATKVDQYDEDDDY